MLSNDFLENNRSSRRCRGSVSLCFASINIPGDVAFISDKIIYFCHSAASFIFLLPYYLPCKNTMYSSNFFYFYMTYLITKDQSQGIICVKIQHRKCGNHRGNEEPKKSNGLMFNIFYLFVVKMRQNLLMR